ncbi:MAG: M48 family metalloprotease [Acidobacteriota bacterium]
MTSCRAYIAALVGLASLACMAPAHALFYDDFTNGASVHPSDELEERIWQEAEASRGQFVRGAPSAQAAALADHARKLIKKHWPDMVDKVHVDVIDNADVLALSSANGDIIVSTGMLMRADTDEELTAILAREVSHVLKRHAVRSVYAARLGAGANTVFQAAVNASSFMGTMSVLGSFQVAPEMLLADGGKAFLQAQLTKIRDNMADNFLRRMSATGFEAMVKTSLFGYSESLETESDEYALLLLEKAYGQTDAFKRVMQRLADEAAVDEKKFSAFYGNEVRMKARLSYQAEFDAKKDKRAGLAGPGPHGPDAAVSNAPAPVAAGAELASDSIVIEAGRPVVAVVLADSEDEDSTGVRPLAEVMAEERFSYPQLLSQIALPVVESELEAGHWARAALNIERTREGVTLPHRAQLILAESLWAMPGAKQSERGEAIAQQYCQAHPDDARGWKLLGQMALKRGEAAKAEDYLQQALQAADSEDERGFIEQYLRQAQKQKAAQS